MVRSHTWQLVRQQYFRGFSMDYQRLRNLTTGKLHTEMGHMYQDLEFITGWSGLMTHILPNVNRACEPWLKSKVQDARFWDDKYDPDHVGEFLLDPMTEEEQAEMFKIYDSLPHPFAGKEDKIITVVV
jgi:hypothetical protein